MKTHKKLQQVLDRMSQRLGLPAKICGFIAGQQTKVVNLTPPAAIVDNASLTVAELDTLGWDYAEIFVILGATDIAMSALKVTESDTSGSGHADVTGLVFGTSTNTDGDTSSLPAATDDNDVFKFEIDLRGRKRYLDMTATVGDGTNGAYVTIIAVLSRSRVTPSNASEAGCNQILRL